MSTISPRLLSVLVTGDDLDGFAGAAPTSHLKVFLPADGQHEPNLPEFTPDGAVFDEAAVCDRLKAELSAYKIPKRFAAVPRSAIPLLSSGKVDPVALMKMFDA